MPKGPDKDQGREPTRASETVAPEILTPHRESMGRLEQFLELIPARMRMLVFMALLGLGGAGVSANLSSCGGSETVDTATDPVLLTHQEGPWNFRMYQTGEARVSGQYGQTLYHFIKGSMTEKKLFPQGLSEAEQLDFINAVIFFCRQLNPQNLDDFTSILGETLYFPEFLFVEGEGGKHYVLEMGNERTSKKDEELLEALGAGGEGPEINEINGKLTLLLREMAEDYRRDPNVNAWPQILAFDSLMKRTGTSTYYEILKQYNEASESEMNAYTDKTASQIQDEIERLKIEETKENRRKIEKLTRVLRTKMYRELIGIMKRLNPNQIQERKMLSGTVLDFRVPFYELEPVWQYKKTRKGNQEDAPAYDRAIDQLADRSNTVTLESWLAVQEEACSYFQKHGEDLGYDPELALYMTTPIILSVIHAEFFSEFSGEAYLDLLPIAIESGNLVYGPAVNDRVFSAGMVQMTRGTFEVILNSKGERLKALQSRDPSFKISVPSKVEKTVRRQVRKGRKKVWVDQKIKAYKDEDIVNAMITDLPSHSFYAILAVADHTELGWKTLIADKQFQKAWQSASESERYLFLASFSAMAINRGRAGTQIDAGRLLESVDSSSLTPYITALPEATKGSTRSRGARKGLEAMKELLERTQSISEEELARLTLGEAPSGRPAPAAAPERLPILQDYAPMLARALLDGYALSDDKTNNRGIYEATLNNPDTVSLPETHEFFFRKPNPDSVARMEKGAYEIFLNLAKDFKERTGGYTLSYTDVLRTPEYQDKMSPIDASTHFTGRTIDIPDGRFKDPKDQEITWSVPTGKKDRRGNPVYKKGPQAEPIETELRPALVELMEEYQARGLLMVYPEVQGGGHWHLYVPKTVSGDIEDL